MPGLKITMDVDGKKEKYEIDLDKLTLGEGRFLKREFGMRSYNELDLLDPDADMIVGVLAVAMKRGHPELDDDEVIAKVEGLSNGDYFTQLQKQIEAEVKKAEEAAADPQSAGESASAAGNGAKTRKTPTRRRSASTA
jgi:hypothetical protein